MTRTIRAAVVACALAGLTGCWIAPGQGPARRSHNEFESGFGAGSVAGFAELWSATTDATSFQGVGHPVVSPEGIVHVTANRSVYAFEAATGTQRWISEVPTAYEQVDTDSFLWDGLLWTSGRRADGAWEPVRCDVSTGACDSAGDDIVGRIEAMSGSRDIAPSILLSEFEPTGSGTTAQFVHDHFGGPRVLVTEEPFMPRPTVGHTRFFHAGVGAGTAPGNGVRAFPTAGGPGWTTAIDGLDATSPVLSADGATLYVGTDAGTLYALATADGSVLWTADVGEGVGPAPALAGGTLYVPTRVGTLVALPAGGCGAPTCEPLWRTFEESADVVQPAVAAGVVFTGTAAGTVHAYDAAGCASATCRPLWSATAGSRITGAPAVSRGMLFVGTQDGRLIAYGLPPG